MGKENQSKGSVTGFRIRTLNYLMILVALVLYIFIIYGIFQISEKYKVLVSTTEDYIECQQNTAMVKEGSDILTEEVWLYVATGDLSHARAYFKEANEDRRREKALEALEEKHSDDETHDYLKKALEDSNNLMEREIYAMRLVSEANDYPESELPKEVQEMKLLQEDQSLDAEEKQKKASEIVFGAGYQDAKELIMTNIEFSVSSILKSTRAAQESSLKKMEQELQIQRVQITILFIMNIIIFIIIAILIIKPLQVYIRCIRDNKTLEIVGSYEFKYLALTYNNIYEINAANEAMLRQKAEHDALTGVMNRGSFDQACSALKSAAVPIVLLLIDVDKFKQINDGYGHDQGDQVLKKVAELLNHTFRTSDFVARIGGDEFAVIMPDTDEGVKSVIRRKVENMNYELRHVEGLPKVSLSVGVAFSARGFDDDLYKKADEALYTVKESGRCGCAFYGE